LAVAVPISNQAEHRDTLFAQISRLGHHRLNLRCFHLRRQRGW
jgi:hypothetical protein